MTPGFNPGGRETRVWLVMAALVLTAAALAFCTGGAQAQGSGCIRCDCIGNPAKCR